MEYSVITLSGKEIRARWTGKTIELVVFGAMWSDVQIEWACTLEYAIVRFNWLIEHNGGDDIHNQYASHRSKALQRGITPVNETDWIMYTQITQQEQDTMNTKVTGLTAEQLAYLRKVASGKSLGTKYDPRNTSWDDLFDMGLITYDAANNCDVLTPAGMALLAEIDKDGQKIYELMEAALDSIPLVTVENLQAEIAMLRKERDKFKKSSERFFKFYEDVLNVIENGEQGKRSQQIEKLVDEC